MTTDELQHDGKDYWWLVLSDMDFYSDLQAAEDGKRLGLIMDIAEEVARLYHAGELRQPAPTDLEALATALADKWVPSATPWPLYDAVRANQLCRADILEALRSVVGEKE